MDLRESLSFKLVGVSSTLEKYQLGEGRKEEAKKVEAKEDEEKVCSVPGEIEVLSSRPEDPNTEVRPRQLESPVSTIAPVPLHLPSASQSDQLRKVTEFQIENIKKKLGVYSSFSFPPGSYQALNVFYVAGALSKFWLSIVNGVLTEFNSPLKNSMKSLCENPREGDLVVARFPDDNQIYRCKVIGVSKGSLRDFGQTVELMVRLTTKAGKDVCEVLTSHSAILGVVCSSSKNINSSKTSPNSLHQFFMTTRPTVARL